MTSLAQATTEFQFHLERHRFDPDDEMIWEDLCRAREALEVAWLEAVAA